MAKLPVQGTHLSNAISKSQAVGPPNTTRPSAVPRVPYMRGTSAGEHFIIIWSVHIHTRARTHTQGYKSVFLLARPQLHIPNLNCYYDFHCHLIMLHSAVVLEQEPWIRNNKQNWRDMNEKKRLYKSEKNGKGQILERESMVRGQIQHGAAEVRCHLVGSTCVGGVTFSVLGYLVLMWLLRCCAIELPKPLTPRHDFER